MIFILFTVINYLTCRVYTYVYVIFFIGINQGFVTFCYEALFSEAFPKGLSKDHPWTSQKVFSDMFWIVFQPWFQICNKKCCVTNPKTNTGLQSKKFRVLGKNPEWEPMESLTMQSPLKDDSEKILNSFY